DTRGNVRDGQGQFASNAGSLPELVRVVKGSAGRFRITPKNQFVLVRVADVDDWTTRFVTRLIEPLRFETSNSTEVVDVQAIDDWVKTAAAGDPYPFPSITTTIGGLRFKRKSGGVISKRLPGGEVFARVGEKA